MKLNRETQVIIAEHKNINNGIEHNFDIALKVSQLLSELQSPKFNIDEASILSLDNSDSLHHKQKVLAIGHPLNAIYKIIAKNNNDDTNTLRLVDLYPNDQDKVELVNMEKSVALFENHIKTFALFAKYNGLDSYYKYVKGYSDSLINGDIKSTIVDNLNYLRSTFNSAKDELLEQNFGGFVLKFNPAELKHEFIIWDRTNTPKYERKELVYKFFVHKFLDVLLSQLPNFDNEEIAQLIYDVKVKSADAITEQLKEKLADFGVTDLIGKFEVSAFHASRAIKLITDIYHYQSDTYQYSEKHIDLLIEENRKGTYIDLGNIKFLVGKEYRNDKGDLMQIVKIKKA